MNTRTAPVGPIVRAAALAAGLGLGLSAAPALPAEPEAGGESEALPLDQLKAFGEVFDLVKEQ